MRWIRIIGGVSSDQILAGSSLDIVYHARDVIGGRWPEGEKVILNQGDAYDMTFYAEDVIEGRWPEAEKILLEQGNGGALFLYAENVIKDRWPEAEPILLKNGSFYLLINYRDRFLNGKWPEADGLISKRQEQESQNNFDNLSNRDIIDTLSAIKDKDMAEGIIGSNIEKVRDLKQRINNPNPEIQALIKNACLYFDRFSAIWEEDTSIPESERSSEEFIDFLKSQKNGYLFNASDGTGGWDKAIDELDDAYFWHDNKYLIKTDYTEEQRLLKLVPGIYLYTYAESHGFVLYIIHADDDNRAIEIAKKKYGFLAAYP